jgi:hypothetical protein
MGEVKVSPMNASINLNFTKKTIIFLYDLSCI